jgi:hypothetical protein
MKTIKLLPAAALAFCACATHSRDLSTSVGMTNRGLVQTQALRVLEAKDPARAKKGYDDFLKKAVVPQHPFPTYAQRLENEMKSLSRYDHHVMDPQAAWGLPEVYDRQVRAVAEAHMGLARLALARSDWPEVESRAKQALELTNKKALSPVVMAREGIASYELLREAYERQGKVGRERLARLNADLLRSYLSSKQGKADYYASRIGQAELGDRLKDADKFVADVNAARQRKADQQMMQAMGALQQIGSTVQQFQINQAMAQSGGRVTPQIQQMQANKMLMDFHTKLMSINPDFKKGLDSASVVLNPLSNLAAGKQLIDPNFGADAPNLIKTFASGVAALSGSDAVKRSAEAVSASIDGVTAMRGGSADELDKALTKFSASFQDLQKDVEPMVAQAGGTGVSR